MLQSTPLSRPIPLGVSFLMVAVLAACGGGSGSTGVSDTASASSASAPAADPTDTSSTDSDDSTLATGAEPAANIVALQTSAQALSVHPFLPFPPAPAPAPAPVAVPSPAPAPAPIPAPAPAAPTPAPVTVTSFAPKVDKSKIPTGAAGASDERLMATNQQPGPSDGTGAFRTVCDFSHMAFDDPIVFPGQPGKSHLHAFFGKLATHMN